MIKDKLYNATWTPRIVLLLRFIVGAVFEFSGFVKAIDPWGVLYKFEDYIAVLGWDWFTPFLLFGAFALSVFEFALGVCLIIGAYRRFTVWSSFVLMLLMTPLTLWLAVTGAVPDCGCFGEVVILSNVATFWKNVALLLAVIYLLLYNVRVMNLYSPSIQWIVTSVTMVYIVAVAMYGYFYQPMLDFRSYKIGTPIIDFNERSIGDSDEFVFVYEKDGIQKEFSLEDIPSEEDSAWIFVERKELSKTTNETQSGLSLTLDEEDVTTDVIKENGEQLILVFTDMNDIDITYTYLINIIDDFARQHKVDLIGVAATTPETIEEWNDISMANYPIYNAEDTELKILARGNPALVYLNDGKIVWKRTLQSISAARVNDAINGHGNLEWVADDYNGTKRLNVMTFAYIMFMVSVLICNRSVRIYKFSSRLIKKNQK